MIDPIGLLGNIPAFIMAGAAWRSTKKNSPNGAFEEIRTRLTTIEKAVLEHLSDHLDPSSDRRYVEAHEPSPKSD